MKRLLFVLALLCSPAHATNAPFLAWYAQDAQGKAMAGAKLYFYQAGGAVAKNVYTGETCAVSLGASLTADAAGRFRRFYMGALNDCSSPLLYKVVFRTAGGSIVWTEDNVASQKTNLAGIVNASSATGTAAVTGTNTSTGYAVSAVATASTDHALNVSGWLANPNSSAVHIVPQQNTPITQSAGDLWFDSVTGKVRIYDAAGTRQLLDSNSCVVTGAAAAAGGTFTGGTGNTNGITATGIGTGKGTAGTGGTTSGAGGYFTGGAPNGNGSTCIADGTGSGTNSTGGDSSGVGGIFVGGAPDGIGGTFLGDGSGVGISVTGGHTDATGGVFQGGATNSNGITSTGDGTGYGVYGVGGDGNGYGLWGVGGAANGHGVRASGTGTGTGIVAAGGATGLGASITGSAGRTSLHLTPQAVPTTCALGDINISSADNKLYACTTAGTPGVWTAAW